jgi:hypothetical protein
MHKKTLHHIQLEMLESIYTGSLNQEKAIYSSHTKAALTSHLEAIYITCFKMVGPSFFKKACLEYIQQYYLTEYDLTFYGEFFSQHLKDILEHKLPENYIKKSSLKCLPDLARWEWAIHKALCGPNYFNLFNHVDELLDLDLKNKNVVLSKGCTLIQSSYPLEKIWDVHQSNKINQNEYVLNIEYGEYYWWIGLVESELLIQPISKSSWFFLDEVKNKGLMPVLEQALETNQDFTFMENLVNSLMKGQLILF